MKQFDDFIGDQESLHQINLSAILTHLRQNTSISRTGLAEITGLNRATITRLVRELIERGLVREAGHQSLNAGRPSILLQLDPDAGWMIGAEIEVEYGSILLTDLSANVLWRQQVDFEDSQSQDEILNKIAHLVRLAHANAGEKRRQILGMGISLPGVVNASTGGLLFAPELGWSDVPVKKWFEKEFKFPIYVNSKVNMAALAESYFGSARNSQYVLYLSINAAVSVGIVINQRIMTGVSGLAGEVGHMAIDPRGPRCDCGSWGCWEMYVGTRALYRRVQGAVLKRKKSQLRDVARDGLEKMTMPLLVESARKGDPAALTSLEETGFYLGIGIANLINLFNPHKVVLGGSVTQAYKFLLPVIHKTVWERSLPRSRQTAEIAVATYEHDAGLMGAVATVYGQILLNPNQAFKAKRGFEPRKEVIPE